MDDDPLAARLRAAGCVFAEEEAALLRAEAPDPATLEAWTTARVGGVPLEVVVGWAHFAGLRIPISEGVFVPRTRSVVLVDVAVAHLDRLREGTPGPIVVDLCCGSGALGAAVLSRRPDVELWSGDLDPDAVACARRHLPADRTRCGDLFAALPEELRGRARVIVCNAPYVPTDAIAAMPPEARDHEPLLALDGGHDGHAVHRRVIAEAASWLATDGVLVIECGRRQGPVLAALMDAAGLRSTIVERDDGTAVTGGRPA